MFLFFLARFAPFFLFVYFFYFLFLYFFYFFAFCSLFEFLFLFFRSFFFLLFVFLLLFFTCPAAPLPHPVIPFSCASLLFALLQLLLLFSFFHSSSVLFFGSLWFFFAFLQLLRLFHSSIHPLTPSFNVCPPHQTHAARIHPLSHAAPVHTISHAVIESLCKPARSSLLRRIWAGVPSPACRACLCLAHNSRGAATL